LSAFKTIESVTRNIKKKEIVEAEKCFKNAKKIKVKKLLNFLEQFKFIEYILKPVNALLKTFITAFSIPIIHIMQPLVEILVDLVPLFFEAGKVAGQWLVDNITLFVEWLIELFNVFVNNILPNLGSIITQFSDLANIFIKNVLPALLPLIPQITEFAITIVNLLTSITPILPNINKLIIHFTEAAINILPLVPTIESLTNIMRKLFEIIDKVNERGTRLLNVLGKKPKSPTGKGGGKKLMDIGSGLGDIGGPSGEKIGESIGSEIGETIGETVGGEMGGEIGSVIGGAIGAGIGLAIDFSMYAVDLSGFSFSLGGFGFGGFSLGGFSFGGFGGFGFQEGGYTGSYEGLIYVHPHEYIIPKEKLEKGRKSITIRLKNLKMENDFALRKLRKKLLEKEMIEIG